MFFHTVILYNPIDYEHLISLTYWGMTLMFSQGIQLKPMLEEVSDKQWKQE